MIKKLKLLWIQRHSYQWFSIDELLKSIVDDEHYCGIVYADDMAQASLFVLELDEETYKANTQSMLSHINVGTGKDITIREMAETMKEVVGFEGKLTFDTTKPDGAPRKLIDVTRLRKMGWKYSVDLKEGLV